MMAEGRDILRLQDENDSIRIPITSSIHPLCGQNAELVVSDEVPESSSTEVSGSLLSCKCKPGYDGNPLDMSVGCKKSSKLRLMCEYKNKSYGIEETFFDGCDKKCVCSEALEVDCVPRCPAMESSSSTGSPSSSIDPLCSWVEDPKDSCCKVLACESQAVTHKTAHPSSSVLTTTTPPSIPVSLSQNLPSMDSSSSSLDSSLKSRSSSYMSGSSSANSGGNTVTVNHASRVDGCRSESNPGVHRRIGEVFSVNCDSKCVCTQTGAIQCEPQCSIFQGE